MKPGFFILIHSLALSLSRKAVAKQPAILRVASVRKMENNLDILVDDYYGLENINAF